VENYFPAIDPLTRCHQVRGAFLRLLLQLGQYNMFGRKCKYFSRKIQGKRIDASTQTHQRIKIKKIQKVVKGGRENTWRLFAGMRLSKTKTSLHLILVC
jgi:hypothetical protein